MMASESLDRLHLAFPGDGWLRSDQVALCLKWARDPICRLCSADVFPLVVDICDGKARIEIASLSKFIDAGTTFVDQEDGFPGVIERSAGDHVVILARLFQAELRSEIYRLELVRAFSSLINFTEQLAINPEAVDERCLSEIQLAKVILKAEAQGLAVALKDLLLNTSVPQNQLAGKWSRTEAIG